MSNSRNVPPACSSRLLSPFVRCDDKHHHQRALPTKVYRAYTRNDRPCHNACGKTVPMNRPSASSSLVDIFVLLLSFCLLFEGHEDVFHRTMRSSCCRLLVLVLGTPPPGTAAGGRGRAIPPPPRRRNDDCTGRDVLLLFEWRLSFSFSKCHKTCSTTHKEVTKSLCVCAWQQGSSATPSHSNDSMLI